MFCEHQNVVAYTDWIYCADCDDIIAKNVSCAHKNIKNQDGWIYCTACEEIVGYYKTHKIPGAGMTTVAIVPPKKRFWDQKTSTSFRI